MKRRAAFVLGIGLLASCQRDDPPLFSVAELVPRIDELNGKTVRVAGYLDECAGYGCDLYPSKAEAVVWNRVYTELRRGKRPAQPDLPVLGIGSGDSFEFDIRAAPFSHQYVVITGKVTNQCRFKGERGCTDRSPDLDPTNIVAWKGPVPPLPQSKSAKA